MNETLHSWMPLWIPIIVVVVTQLIKIIIEIPQNGFQWRNMNSYGGMPSTHTALCVSMTTMIGLTAGWSSPLFALASVVSIITIRDAVGIRWELGYHGQILNHLIHLLPAEKRKTFPQHLIERLGHTPLEAFAGGVVGAILTIIIYALVN
ncbi:MAG: divergent PAP2 family protein [Candidatus Kerfeldbacteria bacterium]|nr:divergent PAP2 family protein [Candidatus Kerfeldbacteria bacterium]